MGINLANLDPRVLDVGLLVGLLGKSDSGIILNQEWFEHAQGELTSLGTRLQYLADLLPHVLGPATTPPADTLPPNMPTGAQWYRIPNPDTSGAALPVYLVVVPGATPDAGQLGVGLLGAAGVGELTATLSVFVPCWAYSSTGAQFVAGTHHATGPSYPCLLSFALATKTGFSVAAQSVTFSALNLSGSLYFDGTQPSLALTFENLKGAQATPATYTTLAPLTEAPVLAWVEVVILNATSWLDTTLGSSSVTVGAILVAAGILSKGSSGYAPAYAQYNVGTIDALGIVEKVVFHLLNALAGSTTPVLTLPGGGLYACARPADAPTSYGLRLMLQVSPSAQVDVCLGTKLTGETDKSNWLSGSSADFPEPGISLYLLQATASGAYSFAPGLVLANVGINLHGTAAAPLFDVNGYTLGDVQVRGALASPGSAGGSWPYGTAARLDGLGIPLGPGFDAAAATGTNPVATSLLAAGSASSSGDQDPVNPTFALSAAYVQQKLTVQLYGQDGKPTPLVTLPINRALGPLQCEKLGVGWLPDSPNGPTLSLLFDGGVKLDVLDISLSDLTIGVPLKFPGDFTKYDLDLAGLGLSFTAGEVSLSGAFVKLPPDLTAKPPRAYPEYDGSVLVKAGTFSLTALGSYAYVTDAQDPAGFASMFIFGALNGTIGGPAFFFVTGLAAGFGYNRQILLPTMSTVTEFPLVQMLSETSPPTDPSAVLTRMESDVPPQRGEYWLAAGVNFTSFDLLKTSALVTVEFGQELEIALLGQTAMSLPPPPPGATDPVTYAYLELGIEVIVLPDAGSVAATALLTANSYVIDPACKLTGGFALSAWFGDNPHAGEFVVTVGGYHPAFTPPSYYPTVPRLAFNWPVTDNLTISGDAYFALTPSAAMAGGGLNIVYSSGNLRAWFTAQMDALIYWAPFQYNIGISVDLGASYKMDLWFTTVTLSVELGATLTVWGPPMGGTASINWFVISFTIGFGANPPAGAQWLDWTNAANTGFAQTLLPHGAAPTTPAGADQLAHPAALALDLMAATAAAPAGVQPSSLYSLNVSDGLLQSFKGSNGHPTLVLRPNHLCFSILTVVPTTQVTAGAGDSPQVLYKLPDSADNQPAVIPVRPVNVTLSNSNLNLQLTNEEGGGPVTFSDVFTTTPAWGQVPAAKWGPLLSDPAGAPDQMNKLVEGQLLGLQTVQLNGPVLTPTGANLLQIDVTQAFVDAPIPDVLPLTAAAPTDTPPTADDDMLTTIAQTLMAPDVVCLRQDIFTSLQHDFGLAAGTDGSLTALAANPMQYLAGNPLHG